MYKWQEDISNLLSRGAVAMFGGRRGGKSTMATADVFTHQHLMNARNSLAGAVDEHPMYTATTASSPLRHQHYGQSITLANDYSSEGNIQWSTNGFSGMWTDEPEVEPDPEPVFDNLGDFLLHKYNKEKVVKC